ncbi:MAG: hypothetical protein FWH24_01560 [Oscillospiraceae bacterium]|nr:hypothetical protein [Oscillospiraceae bacterium]
MVELIVGLKGTGKTKLMIDLANEAVLNSKGIVACVEKGQKLRTILHEARWIDTTEYNIKTAESLYGLVCGLYAGNYDITHIFIDSALKICCENINGFAEFIKLADALADKNGFKFIITASVEKDALPEDIQKYIAA